MAEGPQVACGCGNGKKKALLANFPKTHRTVNTSVILLRPKSAFHLQTFKVICYHCSYLYVVIICYSSHRICDFLQSTSKDSLLTSHPCNSEYVHMCECMRVSMHICVCGDRRTTSGSLDRDCPTPPFFSFFLRQGLSLSLVSCIWEYGLPVSSRSLLSASCLLCLSSTSLIGSLSSLFSNFSSPSPSDQGIQCLALFTSASQTLATELRGPECPNPAS